MNSQLIKKLREEAALTAEESLRLDQGLEAQEKSGSPLSALPEPSLSLSWRSNLNEKLLVQASKKKRVAKLGWFSGITASCALCAAVLLVIKNANPSDDSTVVNKPVSVSKKESSGVEELIITAHSEADMESGMGISNDLYQDASAGS